MTDMLAEIKYWTRLINQADFDDEPLYVTDEEWEEIRRRFGSEGTSTTPLASMFGGKRVIIDAAKALEQRRHEVLQDLLDVLRR